MADGGIIQYIKLALDKGSLAQMKREAAAQSKAIAEELSGMFRRFEAGQAKYGNPDAAATAKAHRQIEKDLNTMRRRYDTAMHRIRSDFANGLLKSEEAARRSAERLATVYNRMVSSYLFKNKPGAPVGFLGEGRRFDVRDLVSAKPVASPKAPSVETDPAILETRKAAREARLAAEAAREAAKRGTASTRPFTPMGPVTKAGPTGKTTAQEMAESLTAAAKEAEAKAAPAIAATMGKTAHTASTAWVRSFVPRVREVLSAEGTWRAKAGAIVTAGKRAGDELGNAVSTGFKRAVDKTLTGAQTLFTGNTKWQRALNRVMPAVPTEESIGNRFLRIPEPRSLTGIERSGIKAQSKNIEDFNRRVKLAELALQSAGTKMTWLGKVAAVMGIDVKKASPSFQELQEKMRDLGASSVYLNQHAPKLSAGLSRLSGAIMSVLKGFGLIGSMYAAIRFIRESLHAAGEAQVSWSRLAVALNDFGTTLREQLPVFQPLMDAMARLGVKQKDSAEILARMTQITGDYHKALRALPVVLDIVASGYMTLEQATRQVGRAMLGDFGTIQRYGIFLEKNRDVIDQLTQRFGGELLARSKTWTGQIERMGSAWFELKVHIGEAFQAVAEDTNTMEKVIGLFGSLKDWVDQNIVAIKFFGVLIMTILAAAGTVLFGLVNGFSVILKVIMTFGLTLNRSVVSIPGMFKMAWASVMEITGHALQGIAKMIDKVFGTDLAKKFDGVIAQAKALRKEAQADVDRKTKEGGEMLRDIWTGENQQGMAVREGRAQQGAHIQARYHERVNREIALLRRNALGGNEEQRAAALKRLNELEQELTQASEEQKDNERELAEYTKHLVDIKQIHLRLEKQEADLAGQRRREAEYRARIERLASVARMQDDEVALRAVHELTKMHDQLIAKRKELNVYSDAYWANESNIKAIEDGINGYQEQRDDLFTKEIKRLGDMVDLEVDREEAVKRLMVLHQQEDKIYRDGTRSVNDRVRARGRQLQIEQALRRELDLPGQRIDELEKDLQDPKTRVAAERELVRLRDNLNKKLREGVLLETQRKQVTEDAARITKLLTENQVDTRGIRQELSAARELVKHGKTRQQALEMMEKLQERINALLEKGNLTEEETNTLLGLRAQLARMIRESAEPDLNIWDDLKNILADDLPDIASTAAEGMADAFGTAFTFIMRDARNLKHALNSMPKGMAKAMAEALRDMGLKKVKEHLAWAISEGAHAIGAAATGNFAGAGGHAASAAKHVAAAAAWGVLAGTAGSAAVSAGNAYNNATDFAGNNRGESADKVNGSRGDIYLTISGVDPKNPQHQQLIGDASREYQERYGGKIIQRTA